MILLSAPWRWTKVTTFATAGPLLCHSTMLLQVFHWNCPCPNCIFVSSFLAAPNYSNVACWGFLPSEELRHREKKSKKGPGSLPKNVLKSLGPTWNSAKSGEVKQFKTSQELWGFILFLPLMQLRQFQVKGPEGLLVYVASDMVPKIGSEVKDRSLRTAQDITDNMVCYLNRMLWIWFRRFWNLGRTSQNFNWTFVCMCRPACHQRWKGHQGANEEDSTSFILH